MENSAAFPFNCTTLRLEGFFCSAALSPTVHSLFLCAFVLPVTCAWWCAVSRRWTAAQWRAPCWEFTSRTPRPERSSWLWQCTPNRPQIALHSRATAADRKPWIHWFCLWHQTGKRQEVAAWPPACWVTLKTLKPERFPLKSVWTQQAYSWCLYYLLYSLARQYCCYEICNLSAIL